VNKIGFKIGLSLLWVGAAEAGMLAGYDFDADASNYKEVTVAAAHVTVGELSSPMDISQYTNGGDTSGVDADGQTLGVSGSYGAVAIQISDATTTNFADAVAGDDYVTFTVTPDEAYRLNLTSITFKATKQSDIAVDEYAVTDAQGNLIGSAATITTTGLANAYEGVSIDLSASQFQKLTESVTFRIYAWGRGADTGSNSMAMLDKVVLNGIAEPAIFVGYDFNASASDPSAATLVDDSVSVSSLTSPMAISLDSANGDNTGLDAYGFEFGSSNTLGAVGIQVTDATRQTFELAKESDNYVAFTITPDEGKGAHLTGISFKATKKHADSVDEYAVTDASGNLIGSTVAITNVNGLVAAYDGVTVDLAYTDLEYITEATEIRIYTWGRGSNNASGTLAAMDKVTLYGSSFDEGSDYYVDDTGNDNYNGSKTHPFATVQHAVNQAGIGSTIYIRGGTYHEEVDLSGVIGVTLKPNGNETVIFDGTQSITNSWTLEDTDSTVLPDGNDTPIANLAGRGMVYVTTLDDSIDDITQLFVDGQIMTLARFPNALVWSDDFWEQRTSKQSGSERGYIVGEDEIADAGVSFTGCMMLFNFENYGSGVSYVTSHAAGTNTFEYVSSGGWRHSSGYFFEGGKGNAERVMLDMAQEWAYDEDTRQLYLWADDGLDPSGRAISGKVQTYAITGDATTKNIVLDGLTFFATTWGFEYSDGITIQNCDNEYPSCSERALGTGGQPDTAYIQGSSDDWCEDITLYNNTFLRSDGAALITAYTENMLVENNLFEQINYTCLAGKAVQLAGSRYLVARRNTLRDSGTSAGFSIGRWWSDDGVYPYVFEYNVAEGCSRMQIDGTAFYAVGGNAQEAIARYNWGFDNRQRDFRWDGNNSPVVTGLFCNLYRNVCMNSVDKTSNLIGGAYKLKGDFHEIYNNIAIDVDGREKGQFEISIGNGGNASSESFNNAGDYLSGSDSDDDIPGTTGHNYLGQREPRDLSLLLRDPYGFDFRPRWDAVELIDQAMERTCTYNNSNNVVNVTAGYTGDAPDIGAYELGEENYWIPGYQYPQASSPIPADGRTNALYDCDLMWLGGLDSVSYNIYLGTASNSLVYQGSQTNNIFNPGSWVNDQTYFWRIDCVLEDGSVEQGDVWTFTINDHAPRAFSSRQAVMEDQSVAFALTDHDPDGNSLSYAVSTQPENGTLTGTAPNLVYTPSENFSGTDSILFTVNNGTTNSTTAIVIFDVEEDYADVPVAYGQLVYVNKDEFVEIILSGAADAGGSLTYAVTTQPTNGTLSGTAPNLTYTPASGTSGTDSFTFTVNDGSITSAPATVLIMIPSEETNVPIDGNINGWTTQGAGAANLSKDNLTADDGVAMWGVSSDSDAKGLLYEDYASIAGTNLPSTIQAGTYTLLLRIGAGSVNDFIGLNDICDDTNADRGAVAGFFVTVGSDAEASKNNMYTEFNGVSGVTCIAPTEADPADKTWTTWTFTWVIQEGSSVIGSNPYFGVYARSGSADGYGAAFFDDSTLGYTPVVWSAYTPPIADYDSVSTPEDSVLAITLTGSDPDGDSLTYEVVTQPAHGLLSGTAPNVTYTPATNYNGADSFTFKVNNGTLNSSAATVSITVSAVNDVPVADVQSVTVDEDDSAEIILTGFDPEGSDLTYTIVSQSTHGILVGDAPDLTYTPAYGFTGVDSFTFTISDGESNSAPATVSITVVPSSARVSIRTVGDGRGYDITGTEVSGFYTTSIVKSLDVDDEDNRYGSDGYYVFGGSGENNSANYNTAGAFVTSNAWFVGSITADVDNTVVRYNSSQTDIDNPAAAVNGTDFGNSGYLMNSGTAGTTNLPMLQFSVTNSQAMSFRFGVLAGSEDQEKFDPSALSLSFDDLDASAKDPSTTITALEYFDGTDPSSDIGMVFFDVTLDEGVSGVFTLAASQNGGDNPTIAGVTFDVIQDGETPIESFVIGSIVGGTEVALSWMSAGGESYGVESTTNLVEGPWVEITNGISGNDAVVSVTNALTEQQQFYRVYLEE
jgi:hypothetical protein